MSSIKQDGIQVVHEEPPKNSEQRRKNLEAQPHDYYGEIVKAMLTIATFAGTITFTTVLTPRDGDHLGPGIAELAYANSLFFVSIMGCVLILASIELNKVSTEQDKEVRERIDQVSTKGRTGWRRGKIPKWFKISDYKWIIPAEVGVVGVMLFVAFFLMLHASSLFLQYSGPFILGSVLYLSFGLAAFFLWFYSLWVDNKLSQWRGYVTGPNL